MNFKHFLALFLFSAFETHTIDITKEFCQTTQTPQETCAQFNAFKKASRVILEERPTHYKFKLIKQPDGHYKITPPNHFVAPQIIGFVEFSKTNDKVLSIDWLNINPEYQSSGYGSMLLRYALAQCDGKCPYSTLIASPFTAPRDKRDEAYARLKLFYQRHGGQILYEESDTYQTPTYARMYFSDNF